MEQEEDVREPETQMLTPEKLHEVRMTVGKILDARKSVEELYEAEPKMQPRTQRAVQLERIARTLDFAELEVRKLYV